MIVWDHLSIISNHEGYEGLHLGYKLLAYFLLVEESLMHNTSTSHAKSIIIFEVEEDALGYALGEILTQ